MIVTIERKEISADGETVTLYCRCKDNPEVTYIYSAPAGTLVERVVTDDDRA